MTAADLETCVHSDVSNSSFQPNDGHVAYSRSGSSVAVETWSCTEDATASGQV